METPWQEIGATDIAMWAAIIAAAGWLSYVIYRAMDHPRLVLTATSDGPRARVRECVLYAISMPILIASWYLFFFIVMLVNDNSLLAEQLIIFPAALIVAIRFLAFVVQPAARELAKIVPIALIAFVILDGNIRPVEDFGALVEEVVGMRATGPAIVFVLAFDYVITALWYWGWIRWGQPWWERRSAQEIADDDGGVSVLPDSDGADGSA